MPPVVPQNLQGRPAPPVPPQGLVPASAPVQVRAAAGFVNLVDMFLNAPLPDEVLMFGAPLPVFIRTVQHGGGNLIASGRPFVVGASPFGGPGVLFAHPQVTIVRGYPVAQPPAEVPNPGFTGPVWGGPVGGQGRVLPQNIARAFPAPEAGLMMPMPAKPFGPVPQPYPLHGLSPFNRPAVPAGPPAPPGPPLPAGLIPHQAAPVPQPGGLIGPWVPGPRQPTHPGGILLPAVDPGGPTNPTGRPRVVQP